MMFIHETHVQLYEIPCFYNYNFFSNICVMADVGGLSCHPWHFNEFQCLSQYIDELTVPLTIVLKSPKCACY